VVVLDVFLEFSAESFDFIGDSSGLIGNSIGHLLNLSKLILEGHVFSKKKDAADKDSSKHGVIFKIILQVTLLHLSCMQHSPDVQGWQHSGSIHDISQAA